MRPLLVAAVLALLALLAPAPAAASDAFYFENETGMVFTPNDQDNFEEECWYGATGVFVPGPRGAEDGSIRSEAGLGCTEAWGSNLAFNQRYYGSWEQESGRIYFWEGGIGAFGFSAYDPLIGSSTVSCEANGYEWEEGNGFTPIERFMASEVDGHTCTVDWLPGVNAGDTASSSALNTARAGHVRIVDSLAQVRGGKARVRVQLFGLGHVRRTVHLVLRSGAGMPIGRASRELRVGDKARVVAVPLDASVRRAARKRDVRVSASVSVESPGGTGDRTSQLVLRGR